MESAVASSVRMLGLCQRSVTRSDVIGYSLESHSSGGGGTFLDTHACTSLQCRVTTDFEFFLTTRRLLWSDREGFYFPDAQKFVITTLL
jgi:hypothetical protein